MDDPSAQPAAAPSLRRPDITTEVLVRQIDIGSAGRAAGNGASAASGPGAGGRDSIHELTEMLHRAYKRHADRGMRAIAAYQDDTTTLKRIAGGECYVAVLCEDERKIVGSIVFKDAAHTKGTPWLDQPGIASFSQLAVEPWLQGRGIGGLLIRTAEGRAAESGALEIALSTPEPATELLAMYARRGYRTIEHMSWPGTNYRSVIMSKAMR
jgi:predicted N-acetyltransferase YhbS